jgi:hypothetical protein
MLGYAIEELHYKPEGHGFDSRWGHWIFDLMRCTGVDSASIINEYQ